MIDGRELSGAKDSNANSNPSSCGLTPSGVSSAAFSRATMLASTCQLNRATRNSPKVACRNS